MLDDPYADFEPRPDQPERYDQQTAFYKSQTSGVSWLIGGNGAGTSEVACAKIAKFVFETEPPRWDTPFWVISNTYPNVMESLWKEKLYGHGHIPYSAIDWQRVDWYKPNQGWPFIVPLLPHPNKPGRNWALEFKSYEQGRQKMQARSIGGFCFSEQFPWGLLEEVLRGCREYDFPGSKFCEFTPIDPNLSIEIEALIEEDRLPPGWEVFRANTECALEAGHVQKSWFDQFFGVVSDEMRETRMTGQFATYEGAVYKGFNPAVHLVGDDVITHPPSVHYRRGIDWGAGPDNPFSAHIAYRNGLGQWFIFDEYYSNDQELTTVDHLCNVQDLFPWPMHNPHYGVSWADPSSPDNIRLAQNIQKYCPRDKSGEPLYKPMAIMRGRNAVIEGIEHIQYLLKPTVPNPLTGKMEPRLFIHKENCPNLARQMRTYRWLKPSEMGLNPQNPRKEPLKKNDHACLIFGSLIDTPAGPRPIESIRKGDLLYSHLGVTQAAVNSQITGTREVIKVSLEDGRSIICTADHPLATSDGEWIEAADSLGQFVDVSGRLSCSTQNRPHIQEIGFLSPNMVATSGDDTPIQHFIPCETIIGERSELQESCIISGSISKSISTTSEKSRRSTQSTTSTKTLTTIPQTTCRLSPIQSIPNYTSQTFRKPEKLPRNGTHRQRADSGIPSTQGTFKQTCSQELLNASIAETVLRPRTERKTLATAPINADAMLAENAATTTKPEPAAFAEIDSLPIVTQRRKLARKNVRPLCVVSVKRLIGQAEVWNLATNDGTYFANGILVSNCDALRYLLFSEAVHSGVTPSSMAKQRHFKDRGVHLSGAR